MLRWTLAVVGIDRTCTLCALPKEPTEALLTRTLTLSTIYRAYFQPTLFLDCIHDRPMFPTNPKIWV